MRFLLDENISNKTARWLRSQGHETSRVVRSVDAEVFALAERSEAVILTRDEDFLHFTPSPRSGIIYIPIHPPVAAEITDAVRRLLEGAEKTDIQGRVIVLGKTGYWITR